MPTVPFPADRPIALVGMMGSGKSRVGRLLAARLDLPFVDSDEQIELAAGCTIARIFDSHGEAHFRTLEERTVARLATGAPLVMATGGGAFINEPIRRLLLDRFVTVWLQAGPVLLARRVSQGRTRPLLTGKDVQAEIERLAELRDPIYAQALITVRSEDVPPEQIVDRIIRALTETQ